MLNKVKVISRQKWKGKIMKDEIHRPLVESNEYSEADERRLACLLIQLMSEVLLYQRDQLKLMDLSKLTL